MINKNITTSALVLSAVAVASLNAQVVLNMPAAGLYSDSGVTGLIDTVISTETTISTPQTYLTATFDIEYTIGSTATGANPFVGSDGSVLGIGFDLDDDNHYTTLEGDDSEVISFTNLSINNFFANSSGLTIGDLTSQLRFTKVSFSATGARFDGVDIAYVDDFSTLDNVELRFVTDPYTVSLADLGNYDDSATGLYLKPDNTGGSNRWSVNGIEVAYTAAIPEPSSTALLVAFGALGFAFMRRRTA